MYTFKPYYYLVAIFVFVLLVSGSVYAATNLVLYPTNPDHKTDGKISGTLNGRTAGFEYQHTYHVSSQWTKDFESNYVRFAADGPVDVNLTVNASVSTAQLRTVGKDLPYTKSGSTFQFTLPGPGNYYLQLPDLNTSGKVTYTVFFFFDDLATYNAYQQSFSSARNVTSYGVTSNPTLDQTSAVQSVLNGAGSIYFPAGIYRTGQLNLSSNTTIYLAPGAVLKGTDGYNTSRYLYANGKSNVRIAGLGTIDANGHTSANMVTKGHGFDVESSNNVRIDDIVFRDTNSWMIHIRKCDWVYFTNLKLFSGKDGIDPDGARDVSIKKCVIQSIDDGFAVKSKYSGRSCERVTMTDCVVFSCASSLKIGTENYYGVVKDITWDNCDAVDSDRGCIMYTNDGSGTAPVSNITWRNIRIFNFPWQYETGGAPFQFVNNIGTSVTNLLLENIVAYPRIGSAVIGPVTATFRNVVVNGSSNMGTSGMTFDGVIWTGVTSLSKPIVFITPSSRNQNEYCNGDSVTATVQHPYGKATSRVELLVDGVLSGSKTSAPYTFTLSGLSIGDHTLQARATDIDGAVNTTAPVRIKVIPNPGPAVQITSGPTVSGITTNSANISWSTNPAGNSVVEYGSTSSYGTTASDPATVSNHSITLTGLNPGTLYHYRVKTQASGYNDGISGDSTFTTEFPPGTLRNPGFEDGFSQTAWTKYGVFDGDGKSIQIGPWFSMMPHSGTYFAGSASSYGTKIGGLYQRVTGTAPGQYWTFSAWVNTYNKGATNPAYTSNRIGIDPNGGTDPASPSIIWSPRIYTQYQWKQATVTAQAAGNAVTLFLDALQSFPVEWNINAFDDCSLMQVTPASIPQALGMADDTSVTVVGKVVTAGTSEIGGAFYLEEPDRSAGIQIASAIAVNKGDEPVVTGKLGVNAHGERTITADSVIVTQTAQTLPIPLFMINRDIGGSSYNAFTSGVYQGLGLYNVGLLVTCFGRITSRGTDYFYIDDGSNVQDGSTRNGIRIDAAGLSIPVETYVVVTGISTMRMVDGKSVRAVRPRTQADITGML